MSSNVKQKKIGDSPMMVTNPVQNLIKSTQKIQPILQLDHKVATTQRHPYLSGILAVAIICMAKTAGATEVGICPTVQKVGEFPWPTAPEIITPNGAWFAYFDYDSQSTRAINTNTLPAYSASFQGYPVDIVQGLSNNDTWIISKNLSESNEPNRLTHVFTNGSIFHKKIVFPSTYPGLGLAISLNGLPGIMADNNQLYIYQSASNSFVIHTLNVQKQIRMEPYSGSSSTKVVQAVLDEKTSVLISQVEVIECCQQVATFIQTTPDGRIQAWQHLFPNITLALSPNGNPLFQIASINPLEILSGSTLYKFSNYSTPPSSVMDISNTTEYITYKQMGGWIGYPPDYPYIFRAQNLFMINFFAEISEMPTIQKEISDLDLYKCNTFDRAEVYLLARAPFVDAQGYATLLLRDTLFRLSIGASGPTSPPSKDSLSPSMCPTLEPSGHPNHQNVDLIISILVPFLGSIALLLAYIKCCRTSQRPVGVAYNPVRTQEEDPNEIEIKFTGRNPLHSNQVVPSK